MVGVNRDTLWSWLGHINASRGTRDIKTTTRLTRRKGKRKATSDSAGKGGITEESKEGSDEGDEEELDDEKRREESEKEEKRWRRSYLARVTHLHLENKGITHVEDVGACGGALVAYLQHNHLTRLANLRPLRHLQELYLQDNNITRLEGLRELYNLRRLFVSGNRVGVVEGLPRGLTELHIQDQRLPPGDALILDPHALADVQDTLKVLDVRGNRLTEMGAVGLLGRLQVLRAAHNDLCSLSHLSTVVGRLAHLKHLDLVGNPVTAHRRYRPAVILAASHTLETLDDKLVTTRCREFLMQAHRYRTARRETNQQPPTAPSTGGTKAQEVTKPDPHLLFIPVTSANHPTEAPATGPRFVLGALRRPEFDLILRRAERRRERLRASSKASRNLESSEWPGVGSIVHHDSSGDEFSEEESPGGGTDQWSPESSGQPFGEQDEKNVWFEGDDNLSFEELPRLVPRPYWRNKPTAPRGTNKVSTN